MPQISSRGMVFTDSALDVFLKAYGDIKKREAFEKGYDLPSFQLMSADKAMARLERMLGQLPRKDRCTVWTTLESFLPARSSNALYVRSTLASTLTAMLELAKQGKVEVKQDGLFRPIYLRGMQEEPA